MGELSLAYKGVKVDNKGMRYIDVTPDAMDELGLVAIVPLYVMKYDQTPNPSESAATIRVSTPTASELREILSEASARLAASSESSTERRTCSASDSNAGSSSSVRSSPVSSRSSVSKFVLHGSACAVVTILALANALAIGSVPLAVALVAAAAILCGISARWHLGRRDGRR